MLFSLVAVRDGRLVGHILFSRMSIVTGGAIMPAVALAPMAVLPPGQRQGIDGKVRYPTAFGLQPPLR